MTELEHNVLYRGGKSKDVRKVSYCSYKFIIASIANSVHALAIMQVLTCMIDDGYFETYTIE